METACLGLGGNVGDVIANMAGALQCLNNFDHTSVIAVSRVYKTPPWGIEDQSWFHNACAAISTNLQPVELLQECLSIERKFKRERSVRWGPRTLDIDILLYGNLHVDEEKLTVPHPRMQERSFVMKPLFDIAPDIDVFDKTVAEWLEDMNVDELELVEGDQDWWLQ